MGADLPSPRLAVATAGAAPLHGPRGLAAHPTDELTPTQRRGMVAAILTAHLAGAWGLLQIDTVRQTVLQVAPTFVQWVAPLAPQTPPAPAAPRPPQPLRQDRPPPPVLAATPSPAPAAFSVPTPPVMHEPATDPAPDAAVVAAAPAPASAAAPAPKLIPASAVQYLEPPAPVYPRLSRRTGEAGRALLRVLIDTDGGAPRSVEIHQSSGHARLDEAALTAVRLARFKPYTENGLPVAGWALIPILFELEK